MNPASTEQRASDIAHDLVLPTLLFAALGAMAWAVRGCSGFGAVNGCVFAGVTWGAAWWYISRDPAGRQSRPFNSGWIVLALTVGIGLSGNRGWMQWPSFFDNQLQLNTPEGKFAPISRAYGFLWLFVAGVPWAGLGACLLSWCGSHRRAGSRDWALRISCAVAVALLARFLFDAFPAVFLPLYKSLGAEYADLHANPNLRRLINDDRAALTHLGLYLGFLLAEVGRRDWRNVKLITTVGLLNGVGWALFQNWKWAPALFPNASFNWWRCWESSGGISIGIAYGVGYWLANRPASAAEMRATPLPTGNPNLERFGLYLGLLLGLGLSIKNGLKGWANLYVGNEDYWNAVLWRITGPMMLLGLALLLIQMRLRPIPRQSGKDLFPHAYRLIWLVFITQNVIAQLVTGPHAVWDETVFSIYYLLLLAISGVIVFHFRVVKAHAASRPNF